MSKKAAAVVVEELLFSFVVAFAAAIQSIKH
jgi:hypothetical protein